MSASRSRPRGRAAKHDREVRGERGLPDAALAARDRDARGSRRGRRTRRRVGRAAAELLCQRLPFVGRHDAEGQLDAGHTGNAGERCSTCCSNESRSGQPAIVSTIVRATTPSWISRVAHHVELGDGTPQLGVDHLLECLEDLIARRLHDGESTAYVPAVGQRAPEGGRPAAAKRPPMALIPPRPAGRS